MSCDVHTQLPAAAGACWAGSFLAFVRWLRLAEKAKWRGNLDFLVQNKVKCLLLYSSYLTSKRLSDEDDVEDVPVL